MLKQLCEQTQSQTSVNELHLKIQSLSLLSKVKDTSLSSLTLISGDKRAQIGSRQGLSSGPRSCTLSSVPFGQEVGSISVGGPHLQGLKSPSTSAGFFCEMSTLKKNRSNEGLFRKGMKGYSGRASPCMFWERERVYVHEKVTDISNCRGLWKSLNSISFLQSWRNQLPVTGQNWMLFCSHFIASQKKKIPSVPRYFWNILVILKVWLYQKYSNFIVYTLLGKDNLSGNFLTSVVL